MQTKVLVMVTGVQAFTLAQVYCAVNFPSQFLWVFLLTMVFQIVIANSLGKIYKAYTGDQQNALINQLKDQNKHQSELIAELTAKLTQNQQQTNEILCAINAGLAEVNKNTLVLKEDIIMQISEANEKMTKSFTDAYSKGHAKVTAGINGACEKNINKQELIKAETLAEVQTLVTAAVKQISDTNSQASAAVQECIKATAKDVSGGIKLIPQELAGNLNDFKSSVKEDIALLDRNLTAVNKSLAKNTVNDLAAQIAALKETLIKSVSTIDKNTSAINPQLISIDGKLRYNKMIGHTLLEFKNVLEAYSEAAATNTGERIETVGSLTLRYVNNKIVEESDAEQKTFTSFNYKGNTLEDSKVYQDGNLIYEYQYHPNKMIKKSAEYKKGNLFMEYFYDDQGDVQDIFKYDNGKKAKVSF